MIYVLPSTHEIREINRLFEIKAEIIGMSFVEDAGNEEQGCFDGPKLTWKDKNTGEVVYMLDVADIT